MPWMPLNTRNATLQCCELVRDYEATIGRESHLTNHSLEQGLVHVAQNRQSKQEILEESHREGLRHRQWSIIGSAANYAKACAALTVAWPMGLTPPGALLGISATADLVNQLVHDTCGWQSLIAYCAPYLSSQGYPTLHENLGSSLTAIGWGMGLTGAAIAIMTGTGVCPDFNQCNHIAYGAATLTKSGASIASACVDTQLGELRAKGKSLDVENEKIQIESREQVARLDQILRAVATIVQNMTKHIEETRTVS